MRIADIRLVGLTPKHPYARAIYVEHGDDLSGMRVVAITSDSMKHSLHDTDDCKWCTDLCKMIKANTLMWYGFKETV